jgi:hypothetical protein
MGFLGCVGVRSEGPRELGLGGETSSGLQTVLKDRHHVGSSSLSFTSAGYRWHLFPTRTKIPTSPGLRLYIPGFLKQNATALMAPRSTEEDGVPQTRPAAQLSHSIMHNLWRDH